MTNLPKIPDLTDITTNEDLADLREKLNVLEALRVCHQKANSGLKKLNEVAEAKIRAEREGGRYLAEVPRENQEDNLKQNSPRPQRGVSGKTEYQRVLKEAGIPPTTAERWQAIASIPDREFSTELSTMKDRHRELSSAHMIRLARRLDKGEERPTKEIPCGKCLCCQAWAKRLAEIQGEHGEVRG